MKNEFKLGDYVRYNNEHWYIKDSHSHSQYFCLINVKTLQQTNVNLRFESIKKLSDLEISLLKHSGIIPKRDLVIGDMVKFIRDMHTMCVHGSHLNTMGFNNDNMYRVETLYRSAGKAITIMGYTFSMLEVKLIGE